MSTTTTPPTPETPDSQEAPAPPTPPTPPTEAPATPSEPEAATAQEGAVGAARDLKAEFLATLDDVEVAVQRSQTLPEARDKVSEYMNKVRQKIAELEAQD